MGIERPSKPSGVRNLADSSSAAPGAEFRYYQIGIGSRHRTRIAAANKIRASIGRILLAFISIIRVSVAGIIERLGVGFQTGGCRRIANCKPVNSKER